jgi:CxxC motif-containing protein (DUF1111 family)
MPNVRWFRAAIRLPRNPFASPRAGGRLPGLLLAALGLALLALATAPMLAGAQPASRLADPGLRGGAPGAGGTLPGISPAEQALFGAGLEAFEEINSVQGTIADTDLGLGPRFNLDSCGGCHAQPAVGGTSPSINPQVEVATKAGATNKVPFFVTLDGPVREARFKRHADGSPDGSVHGLFTIAGRHDAPGCNMSQPDFARAAADRNLIFRIPTPVFGAGLIQSIPDHEIVRNKNANSALKRDLGISGRENREDNTNTITRFGWKAQNKSLQLFSAEAYLVEQGVTNEIFENERDEVDGCLFNPVPEDESTMTGSADDPEGVPNDLVLFAGFMRFLAPPTPAPATTSTENGKRLFTSVGCALCHTPELRTGLSASAALTDKPVNLFSDLLVHNMGTGLADGITQGKAGGEEFRTTPLWGLGQRIFFLHDGRTKDLLEAIRAHSSPQSEANEVIARFEKSLNDSQKQDILNFLRSL